MRLSTITTRVNLAGKNVGVHAVTWSAAITNDLPGRFTAGDSVPQRTGEIQWANSSRIMEEISPMDSSYPRPGDRVVVTAEVVTGSETRQQTVFTGVVDSTSGGMGQPLVSKIIDDSDDLNTSVSWSAMLSKMPRRVGTKWGSHYPTLGFHSVLQEVASQCGFGVSFPGLHGDYLLYAHLANTTMVHETRRRGRIITSHKSAGEEANLLFAQNDTIRGLVEGEVYYDNPNPVVPEGFFINADVWVQPSMVAGAGVRFDSGEEVSMRVYASRLKLRLGGELHEVGEIGNGYHNIGIYYPPRVGENLWAQIDDQLIELNVRRRDSSETLRPVSTTKEPEITTVPMFLSKSGAGIIANLVIGRMGIYETGVAHWKRVLRSRKANRTRISLSGSLPAPRYLPSVEGETGKDALEIVTKPLCIPVWLDAEGVLNCISGDVLRAQRPTRILGEGDFEPLVWDTELTHACSTVTVKGKEHEVTMTGAGMTTINAFSGNASDTFVEDQSITYFFTTPDDKDFLELDTEPVNLNAKFWPVRWDKGTQALTDERWQKYWRGQGSVFAIAKNDQHTSAENIDDLVEGWHIFCLVSQIAPRTWKARIGYRQSVEDSWIPDSSPALPDRIARKLGFKEWTDGMPIIRAGARVDLYDTYPTSTNTGGPPGPELIHDMGVIYGDQEARTAASMQKTLAEYFSTPHPVFDDVVTGFDPVIEVGTVVDLDATGRWGMRFRCLVTQVTHDPVRGATTFTPRVISTTRTTRTYQDVASEFRDYENTAASTAHYRALENGG